jgi:hypothetical protein
MSETININNKSETIKINNEQEVLYLNYYERNKEKIKNRRKEYVKNNYQKVLENNRKYYNKDYFREYYHRKKAVLINNENTINLDTLNNEIIKIDN